MSKSPMKLGTAEKKIIIVFLYYLVLEVVALVSFVLNSGTSDDFKVSLLYYFGCESEIPGHCDCYRNSALQFTFSGVSDSAYILFALYPLVNLVYALDFRELKEIISVYFQKAHSSAVADTTLSKMKPKNDQMTTM